jgi:hypothetical protein
MARVIVVLSLLMLAVAGTARAQDKGQAGLVIGYPASIGIVWHVSENIAIRPDVSFSRSSNDSTNFNSFTVLTTTTTVTSASSGTAWSTTVGLSALFYVHRWDSLRVYVSPRFAYGRATSTTRNEPTSPLAGTVSVTDNLSATYTGVGSLGAQYLLGKKFSVFGEVGVAYADAETSTRFNTGGHFEATTKSVSSRSGVGVVIYF